MADDAKSVSATEAARAEERLAKLRKVESAGGWKLCPHCEGARCAHCHNTGVRLDSVPLPKMEEAEALQLARLKGKRQRPCYGDVGDPDWVRMRAAEMVVCFVLDEEPEWFWSWNPSKSDYLLRVWTTIPEIVVRRRGWAPEITVPMARDVIACTSSKDLILVKRFCEIVGPEPTKAKDYNPRIRARYRVLRDPVEELETGKARSSAKAILEEFNKGTP